MRIDETAEWDALTAHHSQIGEKHLREFFAEQPARGTTLTATAVSRFLGWGPRSAMGQTRGWDSNPAGPPSPPQKVDVGVRFGWIALANLTSECGKYMSKIR